MSTLALIGLIVYGVGALFCWRCVTLALVGEAEGMAAPDEYWSVSLFFGLMAAAIWPLVLLFWRPKSSI